MSARSFAIAAGTIPLPGALLFRQLFAAFEQRTQADLELAKWLALVAMVIDHYGKIVQPELFEATHAIGRISFPLFAAIIGMRLALRPQLAKVYARRLLPWAVISQPVFVFVGRDWYDGNVLLTLLLGVVATMLLRNLLAQRSTLAIAGLLAVLPVAWFTDYGLIGVAMIPATTLICALRQSAGSFACGPLGLTANLSPSWPFLSLIDLSALLAPAIILMSAATRLRLPRLPAHFFYGFYPAHLLVLHFIDVGL